MQLLLLTSPRGPSTETLTPSHLYSAVLQVPSSSSSSSDRPGDRRSAAIGGGGAVAASACAGVACSSSSSSSSRRGQERKIVDNLFTEFYASLLCVRRALCLIFAPWECHGPRALWRCVRLACGGRPRLRRVSFFSFLIFLKKQSYYKPQTAAAAAAAAATAVSAAAASDAGRRAPRTRT